MSNILFDDPSLWQDEDGNAPPLCWDGEKYTLSGGGSISYIGTLSSGDVFDAEMAWAAVPADGNVIVFALRDVNGDLPGMFVTEPYPSGPSSQTLHYDFVGNESDVEMSGGAVYQEGTVIPFDVVLSAPAPVVPVAPDLHMTVAANSTGNTITPTITLDGSPVTADLQAFPARSAHGNATPTSFAGTVLTYTPDPGYSGPDAFVYFALVDHVMSAAAHVTVDVVLTIPCTGPLLEVWQPPSAAYLLRIRGYALPKAFAADTDTTTVDSRLVFLLALANAKAHYGQPDAKQYFDQLQLRLRKMRARLHNDARYTTGREWTPPPRPRILGVDD